MKRWWIGLLSGILILTACRVPAQNTPGLAENTTLHSPSTTPTLAPATSTPSLTPIPPTQTTPALAPGASVTPLPTIPTFTPTFDASTIVTVTPAAKAECPQVNPESDPDLDTFFSENGLGVLMDEPVLDFLNRGGAPQKLITALRQRHHRFDENAVVQQDVTGDKIIELILTDGYIVYVFGCQNKKYRTLLSDTDDLAWMQEVQFDIAKDMNLDGIPELITVEYGGHTYTSIKVSIFEWNGSSFVPLLQGKSYGEGKYFPFVDTDVPADISIRDTNHNGTLELLVESTLPVPMPCLYTYLMPWRDETRIYSWNGSLFILDRVEYSAPEFRFQAIQDGDYVAAHGDTAGALAIYQDAIHSNKLKAFSEQILENEMLSSCMDPGWPTPTPVSPDTTEYPRLAAYAYYRILLLHIVQGHESDASTVYKTLQQKFGNDQYAHPYVEMATVFWEAYQSTHKMYDGCAAAIDYTAQHPEILVPLGSDYHGSQSHTYMPADVCPFR